MELDKLSAGYAPVLHLWGSSARVKQFLSYWTGCKDMTAALHAVSQAAAETRVPCPVPTC